MATLKTLMVKIGADTSGFNKGIKETKKGVSDLSKGISSLAKGALAMAGFAGVVAGLKEASKAGMALESSMARVNDIFRDSAKYIQYFGRNTAQAFGMAESSAYQYAATYGNLFAGITRSTEENAKVTTHMLKASAVVASKTGRTIEDVNERIRSGLLGSTEAIEDLGINVNVAMLTTTDAFKKMADGRSWAQLTFQEQQQIRTLAILEQAHKRFGDEVQGGTAFSLGSLKESFKDLVAWTGRLINSGLAPIIQWLNKIVQAATNAVRAIAGVFGIKMDAPAAASATESWAGAQDDVTESLKETAKAQQKLMGFDEINTLAGDSNAGSSGGAGAGSSPFDALALPDFDESKLNFEAEITLSSNAQSILNSLKNMFNSIKASIVQIGEDWKKVWNTDGRGETILANLTATLTNIIDTVTAISDAFRNAWNSGDYSGLTLGQSILTNIQNTIVNITGLVRGVTGAIKEWWQGDGGQQFAEGVLGVFNNITDSVERVTAAIKKIWDNGGKEVFTLLMDIGSELLLIIGNIVSGFTDFFAELFERHADGAEKSQLQGIRDFLTVIKNGLHWLNTDGKPILENVGKVIAGIVTTLLVIKTMSAIGGVITALTSPIGLIALAIAGAVAAVALFIDHWNEVKEIVGKAWNAAKDYFAKEKAKREEAKEQRQKEREEERRQNEEHWNNFKDKALDTWEKVKVVLGGIGDWFKEKVTDPIKNFFKDAANGVIGFINGMVRGVCDGINGCIRAMNKLQIQMPDWMGGGSFGFNIAEVQAPQIPMLANGGIAYDSAFVGVAEYAGSRSNPEVIAPLDRLAGMIRQAVGGTGGGGTQTINVTCVLEDGTIVGHTTKTIRRNNRRGLEALA